MQRERDSNRQVDLVLPAGAQAVHIIWLLHPHPL
jgi:hypothetical protein